MKKLLIITVVLASFGLLSAQNSVDALRYSRTDIIGSARYTAMGGSFGALGGDASGFSFNPGGIGVYRSSEITFSTAFNDFRSNTNYRGEVREDGKINFNVPNLAWVSVYDGDANGWKKYSFGINFNRMNTFNSEYLANGSTSESTRIDAYVNELNAANPAVSSVSNGEFPFGPSQAYNLLLIDYINNSVDGNLGYVPYVYFTVTDSGTQNLESIRQTRLLESRGNQSDYQFTFGGNYQDKLYLGGSISYQNVTYDQSYLFREAYTYNRPALATDTFTVVSFEETNELLVEGDGVNFKIGGIYRVSDQFRVGATIHSPTFLYFTETFLYDANASYADGFEARGDSISSNFGYSIRTPARFGLSLGLIPNKNLALNVDYDYIDYGNAEYNDRKDFSADFSEQNFEIQENLRGTHNVRVGAELKFNPFVVRAGYNYQGNPYSAIISLDESRSTYSLGGGIKNKNFNFDVALNYRKTNTEDRFYNSNNTVAKIEEIETNLLFTFGWRW